MVIALTNSKGSVSTMISEGQDPELALEEYLRASAATDPKWLIHYERGFDTRSDAEARATSLNREIGAVSEHSQESVIQ